MSSSSIPPKEAATTSPEVAAAAAGWSSYSDVAAATITPKTNNNDDVSAGNPIQEQQQQQKQEEEQGGGEGGPISSYGSLSMFCSSALERDDEVVRFDHDNETKLTKQQQQGGVPLPPEMRKGASVATSKRKDREDTTSSSSTASYYAVRPSSTNAGYKITEEPAIFFAFQDMALFLECSLQKKQGNGNNKDGTRKDDVGDGVDSNKITADGTSSDAFKRFNNLSDTLNYVGYNTTNQSTTTTASAFFATRPTKQSLLEEPVIFFGLQDMNMYIEYANDRWKTQHKKGKDGDVEMGELLTFKMFETMEDTLKYVGKDQRVEGKKEQVADGTDRSSTKRQRTAQHPTSSGGLTTAAASTTPGWLTAMTRSTTANGASSTTSTTAINHPPTTAAAVGIPATTIVPTTNILPNPPSSVVAVAAAAAAAAAAASSVSGKEGNGFSILSAPMAAAAVAPPPLQQQQEQPQQPTEATATTEPDFKAVAKNLVNEIIKNAGSSGGKKAPSSSGKFSTTKSTTASSNKEVNISTEHIEALTGRVTGGSFVPLCSSGDIEGPAPISLTTGDKMSNRVRLQGLSVHERAKQNRDRNREHARNTRLRKKAYIEELKQTLTAMVEQRNAAEHEKRQIAKRDLEQREIRFRVVEEFLKLRGMNEPNMTRWEAILENDFRFILPITTYREMVLHTTNNHEKISQQEQHQGMEGEKGGSSSLQQTLTGVSEAVADSRLFSAFLNGKCAGRNTAAAASGGESSSSSEPIYFQYHCDRNNFFMDECTGVLNWTASSRGAIERGAGKELVLMGILKADFNPESNKLNSVAMFFDTGIVITHLNQMMNQTP